MLKNKKQDANAVGATRSRPHFEEITIKNQKGITLIALIITIIVMLVLVGVTVNVALTGGLFEKGEKAAYQTNVATIKEKLALKKAEELADNNGRAKDDYGITFADLELTGNLEDLKTQLAISKDGNLYYIEDAVNEKEKAWLEEIGITKYREEIEEPPTLELEQIDAGTYTDHTLIGLNITFNSFEQLLPVIESYSIEVNGISLEEWAIMIYNYVNDTSYTTIEETGMSAEDIFIEYELEGKNNYIYIDTAIVVENPSTTIKITRPDGTTGTFTYGGEFKESEELEGVYNYHTLSELECEGCCYSATQTGTYTIEINVLDYVLTDTITIENF